MIKYLAANSPKALFWHFNASKNALDDQQKNADSPPHLKILQFHQKKMSVWQKSRIKYSRIIRSQRRTNDSL
jgi:hypothetical protein